MRDANAVERSDIDVYVLFKDAFVSEGEAAQAEQLGRALASLTPVRLDLTARSEQSQDSLPGYVRAAIKQKSVLLYGEDTREHMSLPGREEYTRDATAIALKFLLWLHQGEHVTYPLAYPDPDGAFFGYDQLQALSDSSDRASARPGIRMLVETACRIGTALLAFKTDRYVSTKRESVQIYREMMNGLLSWKPCLRGANCAGAITCQRTKRNALSCGCCVNACSLLKIIIFVP